MNRADDWTLFSRYAAPIVALLVGAALNRFLERRSKLISFLAHASAIPVQPPSGPALNVHTHSIVVRNAGKKPATNVRLGHVVLPNFGVFPSIHYQVSSLPGGGSEIVFPTLRSWRTGDRQLSLLSSGAGRGRAFVREVGRRVRQDRQCSADPAAFTVVGSYRHATDHDRRRHGGVCPWRTRAPALSLMVSRGRTAKVTIA